MMKSSIRVSLSDILILYILRMKLIFKDFTTVVVLGISVIIFGLMLRSMTTSAQDLSSIPIVFVDYDESNSSRELITELKKVETLRIVEKNEAELQNLMLDEMLYSVFVIEKGYEGRLKSGDLNSIITMYYKKDNKSASIISDIVAGEIIYPASLYKSFRYYEKVPFTGKKLTFDKYQEYMKHLIGSNNEFDFAFQMIYLDPGKKSITAKQTLTNSILYNQFIFGILGMLIAFVAMFILSRTVKEKEMGVDIRLRISKFHILKRDLANLFALLSLEGIISILFTNLILHQLHTQNAKIWLSAYLLILINALVLGAMMLLITKVVKKILHYQVICSMIILLTGGVGFYYLVNGFYHGINDSMVKIIPNSWFIKGFTDIILYGDEGGYLKVGHLVLLIMAALIISLVIGIDLIQGCNKKINKNRMVNING